MDVVRCALDVLECPEPAVKASLSQQYLHAWTAGEIGCAELHKWQGVVPDRPARSDGKVRIVVWSLCPPCSEVCPCA